MQLLKRATNSQFNARLRRLKNSVYEPDKDGLPTLRNQILKIVKGLFHCRKAASDNLRLCSLDSCLPV